jgi:predicted nucleic acid-binding protein
MRPPAFLSDTNILIAIDASTAINLNATARARDILACFSGRIMVPDIVFGELEEGVPKGRRDAQLTRNLIDDGVMSLVSLGNQGMRCFEQLVTGDGPMTLDDGEAATIAYAVETRAVAIVDERKANRICAERFQMVQLGATIDLLAHQTVLAAMGRVALSEAVFAALTGARMRVLPHHVAWVVDLIGSERARACLSLPRSARGLDSAAG